ncbi:helix-turn-helix domain-containing protein [Jeongeupia chitinilytica]|uniref:AraC family transcriptional regulator n=1 Tax=Jeongeupia chitinilytica TaxID=1041641 RepID=A0ABQ3H3H2_9NEIS|nr:AraC family transcriptional regulator [Jeongeupia chitinilytica]GHD64485.1 AraC family transcriptional regulator [Jeongeupia chitinilytica]
MLIREHLDYHDRLHWRLEYLDVAQVPFQWHYHPEFELTLTRHARGVRYIGSDVERFDELDLALVAPNQPHTWHADARADGRHHEVEVIQFTAEWFDSLATLLPELDAIARWLGSIRAGLVFGHSSTRAADPLFTAVRQARGPARLRALLALLEQLSTAADVRQIGAVIAPPPDEPRLAAALAHLYRHYREPVRLDELARIANTSVATLKRLFALQPLGSVSAYLAELRIGHACDLLINTRLAVEIVAQQSGFPSPAQFYRSFARHKAMTPAAFRRRYHLRDGSRASPYHHAHEH